MFPLDFSFSRSVSSTYRSYHHHRPASYHPRLSPLRYSLPRELSGTPRHYPDGKLVLPTLEMGPRVLPIHRADYTESCYMEALQEEINGVLDRMESLHKTEETTALSYLVSSLFVQNMLYRLKITSSPLLL